MQSRSRPPTGRKLTLQQSGGRQALKAALPQEPVKHRHRYATDTFQTPDLRRQFFPPRAPCERARNRCRNCRQRAKTVTPQVVKPAVPSKTSVFKASDRNNAIKPFDNLIGVSNGKLPVGAQLIRLSNGRYQKSRSRRSFDGGGVSANRESELRYNRRGRDVVTGRCRADNGLPLDPPFVHPRPVYQVQRVPKIDRVSHRLKFERLKRRAAIRQCSL